MCGMPGTGKTATFLYVIDKLQNRHEFNFIPINCMKLSKPQDIYSILCEALTGKYLIRPDSCCKRLQAYFNGPG
jgi:Cdc6-like AAA superfamily ATPase